MEAKTEWPPWEFYKVYTHPFVGKGEGLHLFSFPDSHLERVLFYRKYSTHSTQRSFRLVHGQDLTISWIDENWDGMDLFGTNDVFFVLLPELASEEVKKYIKQHGAFSKTIIMSFTAEHDWFLELKKIAASAVLVRAPKFWEGHQLLELLMLFYDLELTYEAEQFILESLPFETGPLMAQLNLIKIHFPKEGHVLSQKDIEALVSRQKLDFFNLATDFGKKHMDQFYGKLVNYDGDFEDFFRFMEGHLLKLYDPSYAQKKGRPSKYDKEIIDHSRFWKRQDILENLLFFGDLWIRTKGHDPSVLDSLRLCYLKSL
ncbi:MAG: hypothetical protein A2X86_06480 [Bdellovibrionales bacterium GWA2_49_15]|nr:MAG: hypothetical protein A2X86_06480 [Bdellovibrionales bacterium GWA2_49_15]HAZ12081.1 hypothetical protein [Bdellovibrionales bacterium]